MYILGIISHFLNTIILLLFIIFTLAAFQYVIYFLLKYWEIRVHLPDPVAYTSVHSIEKGENIPFCIHTRKQAIVEIFKLGKSLKNMGVSHFLKPTNMPNHFNPWNGLNWKPNFTLNTQEFGTGLFFAKISHKNNPDCSFRIPFLIRSENTVNICIVSSTNTWQAYNDFGGKSFYKDFITPYPLKLFLIIFQYLNIRIKIGSRHYFPITPLSFFRPNLRTNRDIRDLENKRGSTFSHLVRGEWNLIRFLEDNDIPYNLISDYDYAFNGIINYKAIIFNTHSEYWSQEMFGRLSRNIKEGKKIIFLSGNNLYREVQFLDTGLSVIKEETNPFTTSKLIGTAYNSSGFLSSAGYKVEAPNHWIFKGLCLNDGDLIGEGDSSMTIKITKFSKHKYRDEIDIQDSPFGASGYETDKITLGSGDFQVLATGDNVEGPASMVFKKLQNGGWIFNVSSVAFTNSLVKDVKTQKILHNLFDDINN